MTLARSRLTAWSIPALAAAALIGCGGSPPHSAASNLALTPEERLQRVELTPAEQREARAALAELARDHEPVDPPRPAARGIRWRDMERAVALACREVEMAVVRTHRGEGELTFEIMTVNERPAMLTIRRVDDERVYEAEATVGRFGDDEAAAALLAALDEALRAFGRKRAFRDEQNGAADER